MNDYQFNWDDFSELYDWEFNLMCKEQKQDVSFYLKKIEQIGDPILEIGCGSGRITEGILSKGYHVTAVDNAPSFLEKLKKKIKEHDPIRIICQDMRSLKLSQKYRTVIISYSTFQYLHQREDQLNLLRELQMNIENEGVIYIDISPYTALGKSMPDFFPFYHEFHEGLNADVTMFTSYEIDHENRLQFWRDKYIINFKDRKEHRSEVFIHELALKRVDIEEMKELAEYSGLYVDRIYGSFEGDEVNEDSSNWIFELRKK